MATLNSVLHVVDSLDTGGLERVVTELAIAQRAAGHTVRVFCLYRSGQIAGDLIAASIPVLCGDKRDGLDFGALYRLRVAALSSACNVLHAHNPVPNYYAAISLLAVARRPVLINTCHDMGTSLDNARLRRLFCWSLARTARVAMVARQVHDHYVGSGLVARERARTILNGVPTHRFSAMAERCQTARAALGLPREALVIGCVGRLVPLKNHCLIIKVLPSLARTFPTLRAVFIGSGPLQSELVALARDVGVADRVSFLGERTDVASLLPALHVFALPSSTEGSSIALLEAASAGLAVVATAVGGNPEVVRNGETGLLIPPQDEGALEAALLSLLSDPDLRSRLGGAAANWVVEHASISAMRIAYDDLYRSALGACPGIAHEPRCDGK